MAADDSEQSASSATVEAATVNTMRARFLEVQSGRMARMREALQPQQQSCVSLLPLLFHCNDASLPGYLTDDVPSGILGFSPDPQTLKVARSKYRQFSGQVRRREDGPALVSVSLMGSSGSIAQSVRSDLDLWVCHRNGLSADELSLLEAKCARIESWARSFNLEVHVFLMNGTLFRGGERETLNGEYCGSTQHYLLLDEFYRTGIHLAGATPVWWYVPPELEDRYDEVVQDLFASGKVQERDVVDFGSIDRMPLDEFLGAAMWQLYKGIDSPWKSLLKLLLLECYLEDRDQDGGMLCHTFKQRVYDNELALDNLDPYLMLYRRIERYLTEQNHTERLELARQCLYQKIGITLSKPLSRGRTHWRRELLSGMVKQWGWTRATLANLDGRDDWGIQQALQERHEIMREFTRSYRNMTRFARGLQGSGFMKTSDMRILGRKLQASFDRKPGKVETLNEGLAPNLSQEKVTLHQLPTREPGRYLWAAYVDLPLTQLDKYPPPLKHARGFLEVLLWCHLNGLLSGHLHVPVYTQRSHLTDFEVKELMSTLRHHLAFPLPQAPQDAFRYPSRIQRVMLYANVGVDPMASLSQRGLQKISNRVDSLDFSALGENLVRTLDMVTVSTWQEVVCNRYTGHDALIQFLQGFFTQLRRQRNMPLPEVDVFCFCPHRSAAITQRLSQLIRDLVAAFFRSSESGTTRYLLRVEQTFYLCQFAEGRFYAEPADSIRQLYPLLAREQTAFSPLVLDRNALIRHPALKLVLASARPEQIVVCFQVTGQHIDYWVHDERGSLFHTRAINHGVSNLLNHLYRFLRNVELQQLTDGQGQFASSVSELDFLVPQRRVTFLEVKPPLQGQRARLVRWPGAEDDELDAPKIQVMVDQGIEHGKTYIIYLDNEEFSSLEWGDDLFAEVAHRVFGLRNSQERFPVFINDLQFSEPVLAGLPDGRAQTYHYLYYKHKLERQLNRHI